MENTAIQIVKKFQKAGIEIVGISKDDVTSHRKFCDKMNIPYILLSDVETEVCKKFGVWGLKKFMGREFMGINRSTFLVNEKGKVLIQSLITVSRFE